MFGFGCHVAAPSYKYIRQTNLSNTYSSIGTINVLKATRYFVSWKAVPNLQKCRILNISICSPLSRDGRVFVFLWSWVHAVKSDWTWPGHSHCHREYRTKTENFLYPWELYQGACLQRPCLSILVCCCPAHSVMSEIRLAQVLGIARTIVSPPLVGVGNALQLRSFRSMNTKMWARINTWVVHV